MKYKTFRNLMVGGGLIAVGGTGYGVKKLLEPPDPWQPVDESALSGDLPDPAYAEALASLPQGQETRGIDRDGRPVVIPEGAGTALDYLDTQILREVQNPARAKAIDWLPPTAFGRVRLYDDTGSGSYTRLRIDRDGDARWDEKWTLEKGRVVSRKVTPNEDEQYTQLFRLDEASQKWLLISGPFDRVDLPSVSGETALAETGAAATALAATALAETGAAGAAGANALRDVDRAILALIGESANGDKKKDAVPGAIKVNLYHDDGSGRWNRLKIDLDRDEKWDEKWTMKDGKVLKRQVAPADDEKYAKEYRLESGRWVGGE